MLKGVTAMGNSHENEISRLVTQLARWWSTACEPEAKRMEGLMGMAQEGGAGGGII